MIERALAGTPDDVLSLCRALREATGLLGLNPTNESELITQVDLAERAATAVPVDMPGLVIQVRTIRYQLVEVADGPISAFMADDAARILGDGVGRLFS
jgi:hypothetical protein